MGWQERAKEIMKAKDITQEVLAEKLGIADATISRYLSGKRCSNRLDIIKRIAEAIGESPMILLADNPLDEIVLRHLADMNDKEKQELSSFLSMAKKLYKNSA